MGDLRVRLALLASVALLALESEPLKSRPQPGSAIYPTLTGLSVLCPAVDSVAECCTRPTRNKRAEFRNVCRAT
jgi:hypothetical protein